LYIYAGFVDYSKATADSARVRRPVARAAKRELSAEVSGWHLAETVGLSKNWPLADPA